MVRKQVLTMWVMACVGVTASAMQGQTRAGREMTLRVDLRDAPRKLLHATETLTVAPGPMTLVYPKWIPGEHGPTGPIGDMAGFLVQAVAADGRWCGPEVDGVAGRLKWQRDPVEMTAFHLVVPEGCARLEMKLDFLAVAGASGFSAGASTSANLAMLSWNSMVVSVAGMKPAEVMVMPSVTMPEAWQFGTALRGRIEAVDQICQAGPKLPPCGRTIGFDRVSLERLIDSPVLAGRWFKEIALAPEVTPKHFLDLAADGPEQLELSLEHQAAFSRLVREAGALYGGRHYGEYHFLVTLSDSVAHFGLEHHESSDDRVAAKTFIDDQQFALAGDLLPHEFTHSWNGKYRRPAGLATGDYEQPMVGDLLWVYEGLTQYYGDVLAARAGLWTPEQFRGRLAQSAAGLDDRPGRRWRDLEDTARMAQVLYNADNNAGWDSLRRNTDFYDEGELVWLDVDTTIRRLSGGNKSLDDFVRAFMAVGGANAGPAVVPYGFDDVVAGLNSVAAKDWAAFLHARLDSNGPHAPLDGIAAGGYRLGFQSRQNVWSAAADEKAGTVDLWFSLGLRVNATGVVQDVLQGGVGDAAGVGPGMQLIAVNGRAYAPALLRAALHDGQGDGPGLEMILENAGYYKVVAMDYHGGERYPVLEPVGKGGSLDEIVKARVK